MAIVGVRFDERLIHGQVATFWTSSLAAERIVVLDEKAATNDLTKATLRMAVPDGVKSSIILKEKFVENYKAGKYGEQRLFIVTREMEVIEYLCKNGIDIKEVNLGNNSLKPGYSRISQYFCLSKEDADIVKKLSKEGVHFIVQLTPQHVQEEALDLFKKAGL